jgi:hypothetical protein
MHWFLRTCLTVLLLGGACLLLLWLVTPATTEDGARPGQVVNVLSEPQRPLDHLLVRAEGVVAWVVEGRFLVRTDCSPEGFCCVTSGWGTYKVAMCTPS